MRLRTPHLCASRRSKPTNVSARERRPSSGWRSLPTIGPTKRRKLLCRDTPDLREWRRPRCNRGGRMPGQHAGSWPSLPCSGLRRPVATWRGRKHAHRAPPPGQGVCSSSRTVRGRAGWRSGRGGVTVTRRTAGEMWVACRDVGCASSRSGQLQPGVCVQGAQSESRRCWTRLAEATRFWRAGLGRSTVAAPCNRCWSARDAARGPPLPRVKIAGFWRIAGRQPGPASRSSSGWRPASTRSQGVRRRRCTDCRESSWNLCDDI